MYGAHVQTATQLSLSVVLRVSNKRVSDVPVKAAARTREEGNLRAGSEPWLADGAPSHEQHPQHGLMSAAGIAQAAHDIADLLRRLDLCSRFP